MEVPRLLKLLSNEVNLQILSVLRTGSFNPRELARILQRDESDVSRRLRALERAGLVEGRWVRVGGKNVRMYSLRVDGISIRFQPGGVSLESSKSGEYSFLTVKSGTPEVEDFFGREREIQLLRSSPERVIAVYGIAGIGKTSLAVKAFPEAFWYQAEETEGFDYFVWQLGIHLNALGFPQLLEYLRAGGRNERDEFELALRGIEETGTTVVIDDLHRCGDEKMGRFLTFLAEGLKNGKVILLSREKPSLGAENVLYIRLEGLDVESAYRLFEARGGKVDPREFAEVYRLTRGHPLAIVLFAQASSSGVDASGNFFDFLMSEVYGRLTEKERLLLQILSLFDEPLEYEAIKALYPGRNVFAPLYALARKGLVERRGELYFIHDLIRGFIERVREVEPADYYGAYIDYLLRKGSARDFLRAFKYAVLLGDEGRITAIIEERLRRFKRVVQDFQGAYLSLLSKAPQIPQVRAEIGTVYFQRGFFEKALGIWLDVEDKLDGIFRADVLSSIADVYLELNDFEKAEEYLGKLKEIVGKNPDPEVELWYYVIKTKLHYYRGEVEEGLESAFKELDVLKRLGHYPELEALVYLHIGDIYSEMERPEEAIRYYLLALQVAKAYSLSFLEHTCYMELTKAYFHIGEYEKAVEEGDRAIDYFTRIRNYRRAVDTLGYHFLALIGLGELEKAEEDAKEMLRMGQGSNYPLAWAGYIFLAVIEKLRGGNWKEYLRLGRERLGDYPWLYEAVLEETARVVDVEELKEK
ncbi:helix-turn-helix domain-containing protein [Thermococcus sp.]|uniref:helix-turn-helix domain-containing protein n=1 Tax=Thermococcus sp. TaxID=35749 RepID=UPI002611457E|nr:helix-turn-helix domain-containing protein [Thermococcus sp.]